MLHNIIYFFVARRSSAFERGLQRSAHSRMLMIVMIVMIEENGCDVGRFGYCILEDDDGDEGRVVYSNYRLYVGLIWGGATRRQARWDRDRDTGSRSMHVRYEVNFRKHLGELEMEIRIIRKLSKGASYLCTNQSSLRRRFDWSKCGKGIDICPRR